MMGQHDECEEYEAAVRARIRELEAALAKAEAERDEAVEWIGQLKRWIPYYQALDREVRSLLSRIHRKEDGE